MVVIYHSIICTVKILISLQLDKIGLAVFILVDKYCEF